MMKAQVYVHIISEEATCCPTCGAIALRRRYLGRADLQSIVRQVICPQCDYYLEFCELDGRILQAYF
jgi:hypothetical protein